MPTKNACSANKKISCTEQVPSAIRNATNTSCVLPQGRSTPFHDIPHRSLAMPLSVHPASAATHPPRQEDVSHQPLPRRLINNPRKQLRLVHTPPVRWVGRPETVRMEKSGKKIGKRNGGASQEHEERSTEAFPVCLFFLLAGQTPENSSSLAAGCNDLTHAAGFFPGRTCSNSLLVTKSFYVQVMSR